ncbi:MAG: hypothetical protein JNG85_09725, partial [Spirochaetaceae bacterium]|nr:hypothetical protein [Spirochaetaceae bacterium]
MSKTLRANDGSAGAAWRVNRAAVAAALAVAVLFGSSCASARDEGSKPDAVGGVSLVAPAAAVAAEELPGPVAAGKVLVVYFTTGNAAERVAKDLASLHGADLERIEDLKPRS